MHTYKHMCNTPCIIVAESPTTTTTNITVGVVARVIPLRNKKKKKNGDEREVGPGAYTHNGGDR